MSQIISLFNDFISSLRLGEVQVKENLAIVPLFSDVNHSFPYLTLNEALENNLLTIREVGTGGSVPELEAISTADLPIILLEGEELVGGKQNRVLNTTILLKEHSQTIIPVSCTERGRWRPSRYHFEMKESPFIHSLMMRRSQLFSVTESLKTSGAFRADQLNVWMVGEFLAKSANVETQTGAVSNVIKEKQLDLEAYTKAFSLQEGQRGLVGFINGELMGLDWISYPPAFEKVFPKLLLSYATEALLFQSAKVAEKDQTVDYKVMVREHLLNYYWTTNNAQEYPSVGYGSDLRLTSSQAIGSALVYEKTVVHCVLFRVPGQNRDDFISDFLRLKNLRW